MKAEDVEVGHVIESRSTDGPVYWLVTDVTRTQAGDVMATAKELHPEDPEEPALTIVLISPPVRDLHFRVLEKRVR